MKTVKVQLLIVAVWCGANSASAQTWTQTSAINTNWFGITSSADGSVLYAVGGTTNQEVIYISTNYGNTWGQTAQPMTNPLTNSMYNLAVSADGTKVFAARNLRFGLPSSTIASNYFYFSTNSGAA